MSWTNYMIIQTSIFVMYNVDYNIDIIYINVHLCVLLFTTFLCDLLMCEFEIFLFAKYYNLLYFLIQICQCPEQITWSFKSQYFHVQYDYNIDIIYTNVHLYVLSFTKFLYNLLMYKLRYFCLQNIIICYIF